MFAKLTRHWRNWGVSFRLDIALSTFRSMGLFLGGSTWEVNTYLPAALMSPSLWQKSLSISKADGRPSLRMSSMTTGSLQDHSLNLRPAIMANRSDSWQRRCWALWVVSQESKTSSTYVDLSTVFATSGRLEECVFAWAGLKNVLGTKWRSSVSQQQKKSCWNSRTSGPRNLWYWRSLSCSLTCKYILLKTLECKMIFRRLFRDEEWNWSGQLVWSDWLIGWLWASINMTLYCVWPQTKKSATNTVQQVSDLRD